MAVSYPQVHLSYLDDKSLSFVTLPLFIGLSRAATLKVVEVSTFWQEFEFGPSAHSMLIAAVGSLMGEVISAMNSYRHKKRLPAYYKKRGFWAVRVLVVLGASLVPWLQGMKDSGVDQFVPFEVGLCAELLISHVAKQH